MDTTDQNNNQNGAGQNTGAQDDESNIGTAAPHIGADGKMHLYAHETSDKRAEVTLKSNIQLLVVIAFLVGAFILSQTLF